jgi:hypothetical protein
MARPTLKKQVELPSGGSGRYSIGRLRLVTREDGEAGFGYSAGIDVGGTATVKADATGLLTFPNVRPNSGAAPDAITDPANTVYELVVTFPDRTVSHPEYLNVPNQAGVVWAQNILTAAPQNLEPLRTRIRDEIGQAVLPGAGLNATVNNLTGTLTLATTAGLALENVHRFPLVAAGEESMPRIGSMISTFNPVSGVLRFSYIRARKTETITQMRVAVAATAAGATPTLVRWGVWSVNESTGDLSLVAAIPNDTSLLSVANTSYARTFSAPWSKQADALYALGLLIVTGAASPSIYGTVWSLNATERATATRVAGIVNGQTDLPSSVAAGSIADAAAGPYFVALP